jgi:hypothetical protein
LEAIADEELIPAFNEALKKAYDGETNFDGYISLITADARLSVLGIEHNTIEWKVFDEGIDKYIHCIEVNGDFQNAMDAHRSFISEENLRENISVEAVRAYRKIEAYNFAARKNRKDLIEVLISGDISTAINLAQSTIFESMDDEMCDAFLGIYQKATLAYEKKDIFNCFRQIMNSVAGIGFKYSETTLSALSKMKDEISKIPMVENSISQKINVAFISDLDKYITELSRPKTQ